MTRILVTGGSGFIGQHLVSELVGRGHLVRVLDVRLPTRPMAAVDYIQGSVLDRARVQDAMADVDEVYHLAAHPGMWKRDRAEFHAINFQGTENVLGAARKRGVGRFLHCSTESILFRSTEPGGTPAEDSRLSVEEMPGPYTRSKMLADQLALDAAASGSSWDVRPCRSAHMTTTRRRRPRCSGISSAAGPCGSISTSSSTWSTCGTSRMVSFWRWRRGASGTATCWAAIPFRLAMCCR